MTASFAVENRRRMKKSSFQAKTICLGIEECRFDAAAAVHHLEIERLKPQK